MLNSMNGRRNLAMLVVATTLGMTSVQASDCSGVNLKNVGGVQHSWKLSDGGIAAYSGMNINIDGYARAYHPENASAGALLHLCNAGRPYAPDGTSYNASANNKTCTGRFMDDFKRISTAGWKDPTIGAIHWFGILGVEKLALKGQTVTAVVPVLQKDGSGFYVSPTALADNSIADVAEQSRYVNPLRIASAVVPKSVMSLGVKLGSFGAVYNSATNISVPFIVGDIGPAIGEGSVALARLASGLEIKDPIQRSERNKGQVDTASILWVFFNDAPSAFDSKNEAETIRKSKDALQAWGGEARLTQCAQQVHRN